jgi:hypothetical protein
MFIKSEQHSTAEAWDPVLSRYAADIEQAYAIQSRKTRTATKTKIIATFSDKFPDLMDAFHAKGFNLVGCPSARDKEHSIIPEYPLSDIFRTDQVEGKPGV